ncbi:MAG: hypothetical protein KY476_15215, partial [Planctomycetes bacterium]|nr:hypothetical protein [Planctomycetota bacterium]
AAGDTLNGESLGPLVAEAKNTDCRAMCVAPDGRVWAGVAATGADGKQLLRLVSWGEGDKTPVDHGPIAIQNPDYTTFTDADGKPLPWHHGVHRPNADGPLLPRYVVMGICASREGPVYVTTLAPFTLHELRPKRP